MSLSGSPGAPLDVLSTPYGYSGQFSPETAVAEQALNRKRLIANLLMQQGLQGAPAGQMVGRFYVPSSPLQGASHLLQAGLGAYLGNRINTEQQGLATKDRQSVIDAITAYKNSLKPRPVTDAAPAPPPAPLPPGQESPAPSVQTEPFRGIAPRPDGPYSGEVGAVAMPDVGVQSAAPPIPAPIRDSIAGQENMRGIDMSNVQPADMSQFANQGGPPPQAPPPPPPTAPMPAPQPTTRMVGPTDEDRRNALIDLLTHAHPQVQRFGGMEMQRMMQETEHARDQGNREEDRAVRREGILENSRMREAQLQNTMALTQMQIDSRLQQGRDANDLKATLAQQANELQKIQMQNAADLKKAEIGSRAQIAKSHDDTLKAIAGMNMEGRKEIAGMKAGAKEDAKLAEQEKSKKDVEGIIAVLRDSYNQLQAGGGVTDTTKGGLANMGAAASSSGVGQALGKTFGTQNQSYRNTIAQQRPILMGNISKALGMSAKQLDSNAELKLWLNAATDPTLDYQTNMRALDQLESMLGSGGRGPAVPPGGGATFNTLPQGAKQIGTSGGKPVYQTPDGKKFIGD